MHTIFSFMFFISVTGLIVGILNPTLINKTLKKDYQKNKILQFFGSLSVIFSILPILTNAMNGNTAVRTGPVVVTYSSKPTTTPETMKDDLITDSSTKKTNVQSTVKDPTSPQVTPRDVVSNTTSTQESDLYIVVKIVDGDTIDVKKGSETKKLRLIGIDTPETKDPRKPVQCFGKEASNKATDLLLNKKVRLEYEPGQELDKYDRYLAYVFREDGLFYNEWMIQNGYAYEYTYKLPYKYQAKFKQDQKNAEAQKLGLWSPDLCNGDTKLPAQPVTDNTPATEQPVATPTGSHTWYLSTYYSSTYYYCDTDEGWKSLSTKYLKQFSSEAELLKAYPNRKLHAAC